MALAAAAALTLSSIASAEPTRLRADVAADLPYLKQLYVELHQAPELAFQEVKSSARMAAELRNAGVSEITTGVGKTGVVGVLRNGPGPVLLLRADMDGLPVKEQTGLPYASTATTTGADGNVIPLMHACGHDIHMTNLVGVARRLVALKAHWRGTVVFVFQPAEEIVSGARAMLDEGLYTRFPKPTHAVALHVSSGLPAGTLGYLPGYAMANTQTVNIRVRGVGGHGAYPHLTKDPVMLASQIVVALQTIVSRNKDAQEPGLITVGAINGGTAPNIIPDEVRLQLTVRSYDDAIHQLLIDRIKEVAEGQAMAAGLPRELWPEVTSPRPVNPSVINTDTLSNRLGALFRSRFGDPRVRLVRPVMGGEDFALFGRADRSIEASLFWLGVVRQDRYDASLKDDGPPLPSLHSPFFAPDPLPSLAAGVEAMTAAALDILKP
jgi:hippurate hydrolase